MSVIRKDRAIVLRAREYGETSLVVTALTRGGGRTGFLAKGARRPGGPLFGRFRTGNLGDAVYYDKPGRGLQLISEFSSRPPFDADRAGLETLCLLQAGLELADRCCGGGETGERLFDLLEGFMTVLPGCRDPWGAFFVLETGLLTAAGVMPAVERCDACKKYLAGTVFSVTPSTGEVRCAGCRPQSAALSPAACGVIGAMVSGGFEALREVALEPAVRREVGTLLHRLLEHHVEGYRIPAALTILKGVNDA